MHHVNLSGHFLQAAGHRPVVQRRVKHPAQQAVGQAEFSARKGRPNFHARRQGPANGGGKHRDVRACCGQAVHLMPRRGADARRAQL